MGFPTINNIPGPQGEMQQTFETVSKNLASSGYTLVYTGDTLTSIEYDNGVIKTLGYTGEQLTTITLSGSTPDGIDLVKTLNYSGDTLLLINYS